MEKSIKPGLSELSEPAPARRPLSRLKPVNKRVGLADNFAVVGQLLQQPGHFFVEIREGVRLSEKIWMLLVSSIAFLALYGGVMGAGHFYLSLGAALGMPFLLLVSLAACVPVMYLLDVVSGSQRTLAQLVAVLLTSVSAAAIVFFSFAPIIVVFRLTGTIPQFFWLNTGVLAVATLIGLIFVTQGLIQTAIIDTGNALSVINRRLHFIWILLYLMVISQIAWSMLSFFQKTGGFIGWFLQ